MKIFNSKTRKKEEFIPIDKNEVKIYACGPTVYDYFHIGNARPFIVFDVLRNHLERIGYKVKFVQNFTDIDDKMINRANAEGITIKELADRFIKEYYIDARNLGVKPATVHPRATENIEEIIVLIQRLIDSDKAYVVNGDVYYSIDSYSNYGCLCGQHLDDLEHGARVGVDNKKKNALDFILWKSKKENEPYWNSPWGEGRPGWHIECSAMAMKYLGETIDIHCGGRDLLFPHHENEIAQSEGATGKTFVNYWMHNGFINIDNEKMSKSKGNFFTIREIGKLYDLEVVRMFMLLVHYRSPVNYSPELIQQAANSLQRLYNTRDQINYLIEQSSNSNSLTEKEIEHSVKFDEYLHQFNEAMNDDLNTADALSKIFELAKDVFVYLGSNTSILLLNKVKDIFIEMCRSLNLLKNQDNIIPMEILNLLDLRAEARIIKDYKASDYIRKKIIDLGYTLEDTESGQKIRKLI